jgi:DtxR family Mn-dependent transcriptional regulator
VSRIHDFGESNEMYLKTIAELGDSGGRIPIPSVAARLGVATVSASEMVRRLRDQGLLDHLPYKGVRLTDSGRRAAHAVVRSHRLWECFLVDHLSIEWATCHDFACDLEHLGRETLSQALDQFLGFPTRCPHGNPIQREGSPSADGPRIRLSNVEPGTALNIVSVFPESSEVLEALAERRLLPDTEVVLLEIEVLDGPRLLQARGQELSIGKRLADHVWVRPMEERR